MEPSEVGGEWRPTCVTSAGWVTGTIVRNVLKHFIITDLARKMIQDVQQLVATRRAAQFNADASVEELKEVALHGKIKLILNPGVSDSDAFAIRRRTTDQYTTGECGDWPRGLEVRKDEHPERRPYSQALDNMLAWFRR